MIIQHANRKFGRLNGLYAVLRCPINALAFIGHPGYLLQSLAQPSISILYVTFVFYKFNQYSFSHLKKSILYSIFYLSFLQNVANGQIVHQEMYVYNNSKDTIYFKSFDIINSEYGFCSNPKIIDSIQIDSIGKKEMIFFMYCHYLIEKHGGSYDISEKIELSKYQIWNLDTKKILFEAISHKKNDFNRFQAGFDKAKGTAFYTYNLTIDSTAVITIKYQEKKRNTKKEKKKKNVLNKIQTFNLKPDKQEGVYKYINGAYIKV